MGWVEGLFFIAALLLVSGTGAQAKAKRAVVFNGPTVCKGCESAAERFLLRRGFKVRFVQPGESTAGMLKNADLYVVPGGEDVLSLEHGWTEEDRQAITDFVKNGGHYLGICLGAYWAGDWPGFTTGFRSLGVAPVVVRAYSKNKSDQVITIDWRGRKRSVFFQDGPAFEVDRARPESARLEEFAHYEDGSLAAFIVPFGKGRVAVSGVHFEATEDWYEDAHLNDPDGLDEDLGVELFDSLMQGPSVEERAAEAG